VRRNSSKVSGQKWEYLRCLIHLFFRTDDEFGPIDRVKCSPTCYYGDTGASGTEDSMLRCSPVPIQSFLSLVGFGTPGTLVFGFSTMFGRGFLVTKAIWVTRKCLFAACFRADVPQRLLVFVSVYLDRALGFFCSSCGVFAICLKDGSTLGKSNLLAVYDVNSPCVTVFSCAQSVLRARFHCALRRCWQKEEHQCQICPVSLQLSC
jgi:hypothetical protein